jgi:hypothetical protein
MPWMVEVLVPVSSAGKGKSGKDLLEDLQRELTAMFGGVTAYARSPAKGRWTDEAGGEEKDDVVLVEVMTDDLDREWWRALRRRLEIDLGQDEIVLRAHCIRRL